MLQNPPDRLNLRLWLLLVIMGALLSLAGWSRFFAG